MSDWGGDRIQEDIRWKYGVPPTGNANYSWLQHMVHHLAPNGVMGSVLANGSLSSNTSNEGVIRAEMVKDDIVDCIVAMPGQLFYSTGIPVSLWILRKGKEENQNTTGKVLFIDARNLGYMVDRRLKELSIDDIKKIADTYHNWKNNNEYEDIQGFCKSTNKEEIAEHGYVLTPGRYVGIEEIEDDGISFEEKMESLTRELYKHFKESKELEESIKGSLGAIGYGV